MHAWTSCDGRVDMLMSMLHSVDALTTAAGVKQHAAYDTNVFQCNASKDSRAFKANAVITKPKMSWSGHGDARLSRAQDIPRYY